MEEGTIVHVDYDLYNADSGDLIETTREEVAKEHDMHQEGRTYTQWTCEETIDETMERRTQNKSKPSLSTNYYATYVTLSPYTSEVQ